MSDLSNFFEKQMQNEEFRKEYDALTPKYELIKEIIRERNAQNLTQREFADKLGLKQSNISRLESGNYNPSLDFFRKNNCRSWKRTSYRTSSKGLLINIINLKL